VIFRDVEFIVAALLLPWFFLTPILYPLSGLPFASAHQQTAIDLIHWVNFLSPPVEAIRAPLYWGEMPFWGDVLYLAVAAVVSLALGAFVFSRVDDQIAIEV
jgi:ABC-type polysaccharide/polyol phosphate export permease